MGTPWVVVPADDAALRGDQMSEGLLRFLRIDAIVGAALILASGQPIEGLWLEVTDGYSAPMAGRDIATLALLGPLANVVISAGEHGSAVCELISATMTNDEINFINEAGTLVNAFNRPSPAVPPTLWWINGGSMATNGLEVCTLDFSGTDC